MKLSIDTKEDSHDDIRKAIKLLQHVIGESQETFANQPSSPASTEAIGSAFSNMFSDTNNVQASAPEAATEAQAETAQQPEEKPAESTEDLFAELFSEEELEKMKSVDVKEEEEVPSKKHDIEIY